MPCIRTHRRPFGSVATVVALLAVAASAALPFGAARALASGHAAASRPSPGNSWSTPPDFHHPSRRPIPDDDRHRRRVVQVVDPVVSNTVPGFRNRVGGSEPSIAVNPRDPREIVMLSFSGADFAGGWPDAAPLWFSRDAGRSWTEEFSIPSPPGRAAVLSLCPCNQSIDYGTDGVLYGAFLTDSAATQCGGDVLGAPTCDVVSGATSDPTDPQAWKWRGNPVQLTNQAHPGAADQPWLVVGPDFRRPFGNSVHVAYDDFAGGPRAQVATSTPTGFGFFHRDAEPPDFTIDSSAGLEAPQTSNPGLRLAVDRRSGVLYALYQRSSGLVQPKTVTYLLNRSLDGGRTWSLGGSPDGVVIDTVRSDQAPGYKFGTVNALLGGVDHVAVGPFGDVYVVYGADLAGTGVGNQLLLRRVTTDFWGRVRIGAARVVSGASSAALPSVAVTRDGTVGVLYDTFDGFSSGYPSFSAHLQRFSAFDEREVSDIVLEQFLSPATDDGSPRQRVLGDFQEMVASGRTFLGTFAGNRVPLGGDLSVIDPIFFSAPG